MLEGLPSAAGEHIARIEALGDNEWLALGAPAPDAEFGAARGRSWGGRAFVPVPSLRGAFFAGEGRHGFVKPDGRAMDDVYFYDINRHAWIAIYPGTNTLDFNDRVADGRLSIDDDGQLQDEDGNPVPMHVLIHAWDYLAYDSHRQRFTMLAGDGMGRYLLHEAPVDTGLTELERQRSLADVHKMSPWFYSVEDCVWQRERVDMPTPTTAVGGRYSAFIYSSISDLYIYAGSGGVATFDPATNEWVIVEDSGPRPPGYDHGVAYDSLRDRLYMGVGVDGHASPGAFIYDVAAATWSRTSSSASAPSSFTTNQSSILYDSANDVITVFDYGLHHTQYTYDPSTDTWTSQPLPAEVLGAVSYPEYHAFYDAGLNVYFVYVATDSEDNGRMWAYRYRR